MNEETNEKSQLNIQIDGKKKSKNNLLDSPLTEEFMNNAVLTMKKEIFELIKTHKLKISNRQFQEMCNEGTIFFLKEIFNHIDFKAN